MLGGAPAPAHQGTWASSSASPFYKQDTGKATAMIQESDPCVTQKDTPHTPHPKANKVNSQIID